MSKGKNIMVNSYDHTNNFNLPLYKDSTPADFRDGYNSAMRSVDENMLNISTDINKANANLTALGADTPEKAATLATDIANGSNAHHLLTFMGITDDTSAGEHINAIEQNHTDTQNNTNAIEQNHTATQNNTNALTALGAETVDKATALKTTIGVARLNATNNTNALTALGAETITKATALKNTINNKQDKPPVQTELVAIGDSYFEGSSTTTPATDSMIAVASRLLGLTCHNLAVGGTGFHNGDTTGDNTFSKQLDKAAARITDKTAVKYVVIGGGRNDPDSLTYNEVADTLTKAKKLFPDSEICFIPMLWDSTYPTGKSHNYSTMLNAGNYTDTWTVQDAPSWGLYRDNEMTDIHPNTTGATRYGHYIANAIKHNLTTQPRVERWESINKDPGMTDTNVSECNVYINGTTVTINMRAHLLKWSTNAIYQINGASTLGIWKLLLAWFDDATPVRVKFDGHKLSVVDVFPGSTAGGPNKILNTYFTFNIMDL